MTETILPRDLARALDRIGPVEVLLLDLFELVLWRDCRSPKDMFSALMGVTAQQRLEGEKRAREAAGDDSPVTLAQIYAHALPEEGEATRQSAIEHELEAMAQLHFVFGPAAELMGRASEAGIRIALIEDTCLTADQVLALIEQIAGPAIAGTVDAVLTPASIGKTKSDILDRTVAGLDIAPDQILYVGRDGSNVLAAARELGLKALEMAWPVSAERGQSPEGGALHLDPRRAVFATCPSSNGGEECTRGYTELGPILWGFLRWVRHEQARLREQRDGDVRLKFAGSGVNLLRRLTGIVCGDDHALKDMDPQPGDTVMVVSLNNLERPVGEGDGFRIAHRQLVFAERMPTARDMLGLVDARYFEDDTVELAAAQAEALAALLSDLSTELVQGCEGFCRVAAASPIIRLRDPHADAAWRNCAARQLLDLAPAQVKSCGDSKTEEAKPSLPEHILRPSSRSLPQRQPEHAIDVVYADGQTCQCIRVPAMRKANGFFAARIELPPVGCSVALQPGEHYSWIEIAALSCKAQRDSSCNWSRSESNRSLGLPMDGIFERRPGVFECIKPDGLILLPNPGPARARASTIEVVYRPLMERSERFGAPPSMAKPAGLAATNANARDLSVPGIVCHSSLKERRINAAM